MMILSVADNTGANDSTVKTASKEVTGQFYNLAECLKAPAPM
jgi:hypothetical protein